MVMVALRHLHAIPYVHHAILLFSPLLILSPCGTLETTPKLPPSSFQRRLSGSVKKGFSEGVSSEAKLFIGSSAHSPLDNCLLVSYNLVLF